MEQEVGAEEQSESRQQYEMMSNGLEGDILCNASFQPHHDLDLLDSPRHAASLECVNGQPQVVLPILGRTNHHLLNSKEEMSKARKRQKTSSFSFPFPQEINGQELQSSAVNNGCHRDRARLSRAHPGLSLAYSSLHECNHQSLEAPETTGLEYTPRDGFQWSGHAGSNSCRSRVTELYAELVKELELQVTELQRLLASREEISVQQDRRIKRLELENQQLKSQLQSLEEQNDLLSSRSSADKSACGRLLLDSKHSSVDITENNLQFLKGLVGYLERSSTTQVNGTHPLVPLHSKREPKYSSTDMQEPPILPPPADVRVSPILPPPAHVQETAVLPPTAHVREPLHEDVREPPYVDVREALVVPPAHVRESSPVGMLRVSSVTSGFQYWMNAEDSSGSPAAPNDSSGIWDETIQDTLPDGTPAWASPAEENGRPKLELIPNSGVYITHHQLDDLSQISTDKPKLMTRRLLDYFFSRETLARSSATGQRIAHNNTTMEKPIRLPIAVVNAIKEYVTKACGRGCNFNAVINSKCGTSRRAVKKMSIRIDWMEGGRQRCPTNTFGPKGSLFP
ncbi:uncharacterized protein LOC115481498 isoform X2 [Microcaecilia unicolor]|nr:uncharacterized protein LOC115481498 isoform X2 [Microcaecilia unicolor]